MKDKRKKIVGITMRIMDIEREPDQRDAISKDWNIYISDGFPNLIPFPLFNNPDQIVEWVEYLNVRCLILSNGNDCGSAPDRDQTEKKVIEYFTDKNLPILGVCRGFQILNLYYDGNLETNLKKKSGENHVALDHEIDVLDLLDVGEDKKIRVNSYHNQGVMESGLSKDLNPFAVSERGVVEGFYHPNKPILGLQWHPERHSPSKNYDFNLISRFWKEGAFWAKK